MARVALMTTGILYGPVGDPRVQGFMDRLDGIWAAADANPDYIASDGFIGLSGPESAAGPWGTQTCPTIFISEGYADRVAQTLTLWRSLESAFLFAYSGVHAEALGLRKEWFVKSEWPSYVAWWVDDDHTPAWQEACERYDRLYRDGPSPDAFSFKQAFGVDGLPYKIDREALKGRSALRQENG